MVRDVFFNPDGTRVLVVQPGEPARIWPADGVGKPIELGGFVNDAAFSPDGAQVVTGSDDGIVRIWPADGRGVPIVLGGQEREVKRVDFTKDGTRVVTVTDEDVARVWRVAWTTLTKHFADSTSACLTVEQRESLPERQRRRRLADLWLVSGEMVARGRRARTKPRRYVSPCGAFKTKRIDEFAGGDGDCSSVRPACGGATAPGAASTAGRAGRSEGDSD